MLAPSPDAALLTQYYNVAAWHNRVVDADDEDEAEESWSALEDIVQQLVARFRVLMGLPAQLRRGQQRVGELELELAEARERVDHLAQKLPALERRLEAYKALGTPDSLFNSLTRLRQMEAAPKPAEKPAGGAGHDKPKPENDERTLPNAADL